MLKLSHISRRFGEFLLQDVSLEVDSGSYYMILGASGAGKSMLLELIAGINQPDKGDLMLEGRNITREAMQKRRTGMVFQDPSLFPHRSVRQNIAYGLKGLLPRNEMEKRVQELATLMSVESLLDRMPSGLSGGEQQRVALARALAPRPACLLLDEPLSSLDAQLKDEMQILLRRINREGQTIIQVTHDYREALALAHQVSVIQEGKIIQTGSPDEVFSRPVNRFVADFTGVRNFFRAKAQEEGRLQVEDKLEMQVPLVLAGDEGYVMFGKEQVLVSKTLFESSALNSFEGQIKDVIPVEEGVELVVDTGISIRALVSARSFENFAFSMGDRVWIHLKATAINFIKST